MPFAIKSGGAEILRIYKKEWHCYTAAAAAHRKGSNIMWRSEYYYITMMGGFQLEKKATM